MTVSSTNNEPAEHTLRVIDIIEGTSVDGPGLRTTVYLAGCTHRCPGCHNPSTWDPQGGREMTVASIADAIADSEFPLTLSGGDPLMQPKGVEALLREVKARMKGDIWLYTGYTFEEILASKSLSRLLPLIDVVVDGPFVQRLKDTSLIFRGSSNQRLIDVQKSLQCREIIEYIPQI